MREENLKIRLEKKTVVMCAVAVFVLFLLMHYWGAVAGMLLNGLMPLLLGFAVAYLININMAFYERHFPRGKGGQVQTASKPLCLLLTLLTILLVVVLVVVLIVPQFISCVQTLIQKAPEAIDQLTANPSIASALPDSLETLDWDKLMSDAASILKSGLSGMAENVSSGFSALVTAFLSFIFAIYFLSGKTVLKKQASRLLRGFVSPERAVRLRHVLHVFDDSFHRYVVGQCTEAVILGVLCVLGMLLLRLPYAEMIGTLVGVSSLIPVAGAYVGALVGAFMILSVSAKKALVFLIFLVVLQQVEGNLIYPRVVGKSVGLPGIWVLAAVSVGGALLGVSGMLLAVPIASAFYHLLREALQRREAA
ncbi:MAG: AI-2E family transporter [Oscillospiraceae bacterium]|nr:AI-2E family transporter [Oscillospiraceae bacterium]